MKHVNYQKYFLIIFKNLLNNNRDHVYKITDQSDKIVVWLVGFSIATIALCISNQSNLNLISTNLPRSTIIFASISAIFGIFYRLLLFVSQNLETNILMAFEGYVEGYTNPPDFPVARELNDSDSYEDIVGYLKADFDITVETIDTAGLTSEQTKYFRKSMIEYYDKLNKFSNGLFEHDVEEIKGILSSYMGYSKRRLDKMLSPQKQWIKLSTLFWFFYYAALISFFITTLSFASGAIFFLIKYLH
jgi:hypothetical protein